MGLLGVLGLIGIVLGVLGLLHVLSWGLTTSIIVIVVGLVLLIVGNGVQDRLTR